jgi:hypothetical protein
MSSSRARARSRTRRPRRSRTTPAGATRVVGFLHGDDGPHESAGAAAAVLGHFRDLPRIVKEEIVDEVLIAAPRSRVESIEELVGMAKTIGVRAHVIADFMPGAWRSVQAQDLDGHLLLTLTPFPDDHVRLFTKRMMDIAGAGLALLVLAPLMLSIAVLIKLTSPGPVLFVQKRAGLNGRLFDFYKFRTMVAGAEQMRFSLLEQNEMHGPVFKMRADPRITGSGRCCAASRSTSCRSSGTSSRAR